jgi:hypothetical protein
VYRLHIETVLSLFLYNKTLLYLVDKMKILGITIPTNGKYEDLIKLNYDEKKVKIKNIIQSDPLKFYRFAVSIYIGDV